MPKDHDDLITKTNAVLGATDYVQLDIMDGLFVPEKTWPYIDQENPGEPISDIYWLGLQAGNSKLPLMSDLKYELDLMVKKPDQDLFKWLALGPSRIVFHHESIDNVEDLLKKIESEREIIELGISFDDDANIEDILHTYLPHFDYVQVMGIDEIGYQGQDFEDRALYNIRTIKQHYPDIPISVDGSVNKETITLFKNAGVTRFVSGSAIYNSGNPIENIEYLNNLIS